MQSVINKLSNNFKVCWFHIGVGTKAEFTQQVMPTSFTNANSYSIVATVNSKTNSQVANSSYYIYYRESNTQITYYSTTSANLGSRNVIVIGY